MTPLFEQIESYRGGKRAVQLMLHGNANRVYGNARRRGQQWAFDEITSGRWTRSCARCPSSGNNTSGTDRRATDRQPREKPRARAGRAGQLADARADALPAALAPRRHARRGDGRNTFNLYRRALHLAVTETVANLRAKLDRRAEAWLGRSGLRPAKDAVELGIRYTVPAIVTAAQVNAATRTVPGVRAAPSGWTR